MCVRPFEAARWPQAITPFAYRVPTMAATTSLAESRPHRVGQWCLVAPVRLASFRLTCASHTLMMRLVPTTLFSRKHFDPPADDLLAAEFGLRRLRKLTDLVFQRGEVRVRMPRAWPE
jgi:hypothetical protein